MWKYRLWFSLGFYALYSLQCLAQEQPHFLEKLTTREGLGSNKVNDIVQDDNGFLWIATSDGLNRFDGTEIVQYHHQENKNSLSHNYVHCLKKLPGNYIAIGTQSGLSFFNSSTGIFQNFYYTKNDMLDEYNNTIRRLETDMQGNLWVGSTNCIFVFDKDRKLTKVISSPFSEAEIDKRRQKFVDKIIPLADGNTLLYLYNGWQICENGTFTLTPLENSTYKYRLKFLLDACKEQRINKPDYFPAASVFKVYGNYFLFINPCKDSLLLYNDQGQLLNSCFSPFNKYPYILWSQTVSMMDSANLLFSFHNYGLAIIRVDWQQGRPVIRQPGDALFESYEYGNALKDRQGNWWLATSDEGLQKISPQKQYFRTHDLKREAAQVPIKYEANTFFRFNNTLLVGTYGEGIFEYDLVSGKMRQHDLASLVNNSWSNFIWNIRQVSTDTFWVGTQAGLFWYTIPNKKIGRIPNYPGKPAVLDSVAITTQFVDSHGLVWMGLGKGKGLCCFDSRLHRCTWYPGSTIAGYPLRYPIDITEDRNHDIWFANDANAVLVKWDRASSHFSMIPIPSAIQKQVGNVHAILNGTDSVLWMGSTTGGLLKFNRSTGMFTVYGHDKGLVNSNVSSLFSKDSGKLWLTTDGGLSCFDIKKESFTNYTANDGLPVETPTAHFYFDAMQQRLYNGGKGIFFHFNPDSISVSYPPQPTVITSILVNGLPYDPVSGTAKFSAKQNTITIHYTAIDLGNGPSTKYAYKLMGKDTGWIMAGDQRQINFSHLAPGNYTFMVRASNSNWEWSNEAAMMRFSIKPPFTSTWLFFMLIVLLIAAVFYGLYRFRVKQIMQTERIRTEISQNLHDEVGSTLTNISLSSLLAQKQVDKDDGISRILDRIYQDSQQVSESMREIVWSIDPKIDTVGEAIPRMLHYASDLLEAKNMEVRAVVSPEIEQLKLSMQERRDLYLIFKEAINNLAKHSKASLVNIEIELNRGILVMTIADNGKGFDTTISPDSNGLKNMQKRANDHHWKLAIDSASGKGTTLVLKAQIA